MSLTLYFVAIVICIISMIISWRLHAVFRKQSKIQNARKITGRQMAEMMLAREGIHDVNIGAIGGTLTDHYDPRTKVINLSEKVYDSDSIAAVAVAAHECGHAIQHHEGYFPLRAKSAMVPVVNIGSKLGMLIFMVGLIFSASSGILLDIGIILFSSAALFQFITLPVEFNASHRALKTINEMDVLDNNEYPGARKMLTMAALTYVAAAAASLVQLLRLIAIRNKD